MRRMAALVSLKPSSTGCAAHRHDAASCDAIPPSLTPVWIAGHCIKRLGKQDVLKANVQDLTTQILNFIGVGVFSVAQSAMNTMPVIDFVGAGTGRVPSHYGWASCGYNEVV